MLKPSFILIAFALCGLNCLAAPPLQQEPQDWIQLGGHNVHPTRILVRYKQGAVTQVQATQASTFNNLNLAVRRQFQFVPGLTMLDAQQGGYVAGSATAQERADALQSRIDALRATGQFEYVEPDYEVSADLQPTDVNYLNGTLWGLHNTGIQGGLVGADIDAEHAWDITTGSTNVIVAVIDTGIRYTHQELASQMWRNPGESGGGKENNGIDDDGDGYIDDVFGINAINGSGDPFDDNDHGTHVSGTIGAQANGGGPHVGVNWNVQLMACKFLNANGNGSTADAIECLNFAVSKGVKIANNSWGGTGFSQALFDAISVARGSNLLFVAAAGNDGLDNDQSPHYPANYDLDNIISVAALDRTDHLASFSDYGLNTVDLGAPGVAIFSSTAESDSSYALFDGTSMATPHVTGVAALLKARYPTETYFQMRERLLSTVVTNSAMAGRSVTGGRLNAFNALSAATNGILKISVTPPSGTELLTGSTNAVAVRVTDLFRVFNATVTATVSSGGALIFLDNGVPPDLVTNDATYTTNFIAQAGLTNATTVTLTIIASASGKQSVTNTVTYIIVPPPPNDYFTNATKIPAAGGLFTGTNKFAMRESGEPSHAGTSGTHSLWWNWSPAASGPVLLDTAGSTFDTVLAVYTGNNVSALTNVASVDDVATPSGTRLQGYVSFNAIGGRTYRIAVAGFSANQFGTIRLRAELNGVPDTNAPFVFITSPVSGSVVSTNHIVISGTALDPTPSASGVSEVQVAVSNSIAGTVIGTTNWSTTVLLNIGANIIGARAFDFAGNLSAKTEISVIYTPTPPSNDHFVNASNLTSASGSSTVSTVLATKEFGEPNHGGNVGGKSVWWKLTAPADGVLFVSTTNSDYDTLLGLYIGNAVGSLTTVAGNDDAPGGGFFSELAQAVTAGQVYRIAVDGYAGASGTAQLSYSFTAGAVFSLTLTNTSGGGVAPSSGLFASNATVMLVASPNPNFRFDGWTGSFSAVNNPLSVTMLSNITLTASFSLSPHTDGFESGNLQTLAWTQGGNAPWIVESTNVSAGSFAARSGVIGNGQTSSLLLTGTFQAGLGSFDLMVSSEPGFDYLDFLVDGFPVSHPDWSGDVGWNNFSFFLPAGTHSLEWRYRKDQNFSAGLDAAFIDNLDLPVGVPINGSSPAHLSLRLQDDGTFVVDLTGQANQTYVLQSSADLADWQSISTNVAVGGEAHIPVSNSGPTRYYRAFVPVP